MNKLQEFIQSKPMGFLTPLELVELLKLEVLDHVIIGHPGHGKGFCSLRELGYCA